MFRVDPSALQYSFDPSVEPVLWVEPGATVEFETSDDAYARMANGETYDDIARKLNPVSGPVGVVGAVHGDSLIVEILAIDIKRAWVVWIPGLGGLGDKTDVLLSRQVGIDSGALRLTDTVSVPLDPMIGCIGVAPKKGVGSTVSPVGRWGGNMDLRELRVGTSISFPVFHSGALLCLGDVHAAMGAGEPCCIAIEASASVTVRVGLQKGETLESPRLRLPGATACVGIGQKITQAQVMAIDQAYDLLTRKYGMSPCDAYAFAAAQLELRFGGPASPIALAVIKDPPLDGAA